MDRSKWAERAIRGLSSKSWKAQIVCLFIDLSNPSDLMSLGAPLYRQIRTKHAIEQACGNWTGASYQSLNSINTASKKGLGQKVKRYIRKGVAILIYSSILVR